MRIVVMILLCAISTPLSVMPNPSSQGGEVADDTPEPYFFYYLDEPIALGETPDVLAIYDRAQGSDDVLERLMDDAELADRDLQPHPIGQGWHTVRFNGTSLDAPAGIPGVIRRLADLDVAGRFFFSPVFIGSGGGPVIVPPEILVAFEDGVSAADVTRLLREAGAPGAGRTPFAASLGNAFKVATHDRSGIDVLAIANRLTEMPEVIFAEPNMIVTGRSGFIPSDPEFHLSWGLLNLGQFTGAVPGFDINVVDAWDFTLGDPSIITVVIDVGVQQDHPDINQIPGRDFTGEGGGGGPVNECDNHGTPVASVISGKESNDIGTVGVAPRTKIASARTFISTSFCDFTWITQLSWTVDALQWAQDIGARITNNSNFYGNPSNTITFMYAKTGINLFHVSIAGNIIDNRTEVTYPGNLNDVRAVSAMDWNGNLASFSRWGPEIDFTAPGRTILVADRTGSDGLSSLDTVFCSGTSLAAPMLAGTVALRLSKWPQLTPANILETLSEAATDLGIPGRDEFFGEGLINAEDTINAPAIIPIFSDDFESGDSSGWSAIGEVSDTFRR